MRFTHMLQCNMMEGLILDKIQETFLYMLKVERNFSEYTLKSYHDDLVQFNNFLEREHLQLRLLNIKMLETIWLFIF